MGIKAGSPNGITIVGGRPMHRAVEATDLPQGVEQVLTIAALDPVFRAQVARDPISAAAAKGIRLDPVEAALLQSMPAQRLAAMTERLIIPRSSGRRTFMKAVSASIVAMVTGQAFLLCSGCTGADTFEPDTEPEQRWMELAGYTCYVCIPTGIPEADAGTVPVVLALHGEGETCLSSAQRWQAVGEQAGFCLVAINWTEDARLPEQRKALVSHLQQIVEQLGEQLRISTGDVYLTARGMAADLLVDAVYLGGSSLSCKAVNLLGGAPKGDWIGQADTLLAPLGATPPKLCYVLGKVDDDYAQGKAFAEALVARGVTVHRQELEEATDSAKLSFADIWSWMSA